MIENNLIELFSELYQENIRILNDSDVDMTCELDTQVISRIYNKVKTKETMI